MSSAGLNTDMEMSVPLVTGIVSNAWFHSSPHIKLTLLQIIDILYFCLTDSLLNYALDFVVNLNEVMAVRWP